MDLEDLEWTEAKRLVLSKVQQKQAHFCRMGKWAGGESTGKSIWISGSKDAIA